jgi:vancomycin resistance protein VanJ
MLHIKCRCGNILHADEQHLGRRVRCRCGRTLTVRAAPRDRGAPAKAATAAGVAGMLDRWELRVRELLQRRGWRASHTSHASRTAPQPRPAPRARAAANTGDRERYARWLEWASWGYLALALVVVVLVWGLGDRWWGGTVLLFGPRWVLLLPLALLVPAAIWLRRGRTVVSLAPALLIVLFPVMGMRAGWQGLLAGGSAEATLRVATLNADDDPSAVVRLLSLMQRWGTDLAAIQECHPNTPEWVGYIPGWQLRADGGLCLLSRYPIERVEVMQFEELEGVRLAGIGGSSVAARYAITLPERRIYLVNLHLETPRKGLEGLVLQRQVEGVRDNLLLREIESRRTFEWVDEHRDSLIVLGDFNQTVESALYRASWAAFDNAFSRAGWGFGMTKDNGRIRVRIDHILSGSGWRAHRAWVGPDVGSDHWPVFAELRWVGR